MYKKDCTGFDGAPAGSVAVSWVNFYMWPYTVLFACAFLTLHRHRHRKGNKYLVCVSSFMSLKASGLQAVCTWISGFFPVQSISTLWPGANRMPQLGSCAHKCWIDSTWTHSWYIFIPNWHILLSSSQKPCMLICELIGLVLMAHGPLFLVPRSPWLCCSILGELAHGVMHGTNLFQQIHA